MKMANELATLRQHKHLILQWSTWRKKKCRWRKKKKNHRLTNNSYKNDKHCATIMMAYPIRIQLVSFVCRRCRRQYLKCVHSFSHIYSIGVSVSSQLAYVRKLHFKCSSWLACWYRIVCAFIFIFILLRYFSCVRLILTPFLNSFICVCQKIDNGTWWQLCVVSNVLVHIKMFILIMYTSARSNHLPALLTTTTWATWATLAKWITVIFWFWFILKRQEIRHRQKDRLNDKKKLQKSSEQVRCVNETL